MASRKQNRDTGTRGRGDTGKGIHVVLERRLFIIRGGGEVYLLDFEHSRVNGPGPTDAVRLDLVLLTFPKAEIPFLILDEIEIWL